MLLCSIEEPQPEACHCPYTPDDSDQSDKELVQGRGPFRHGERHPFEIIFEEYARYAMSVIE